MSNTSNPLQAGVKNMLFGCGGIGDGDRVLIVSEPAGLGYYDDGLAQGVAKNAQALGLIVQTHEVPFSPAKPVPSPDLIAATQAADLTVFLARVGDQLRFDELPDETRAIVSYAITESSMASGFGHLNHRAMSALRGVVDAAIMAAEEVKITCPAGTHVTGHVARSGSPPADSNTKRFPRLVHTPMPTAQFCGQIAQCGFLVGTGSQYYQPYTCPIDDVLMIRFEGNQIIGFDGTAADISRAQEHYAHVGRLFDIDQHFVHSWHAGIHPACAFPGHAAAGFDRWTGSAFGNPRLLHFHTCGAYAPGEISVNIVDPTVSVDGVAIYEKGRLCPERVSGGPKILTEHPDLAAALADPVQECGLGPKGRLSFA